jgi:hypothetical protein
MVTDDTQMTLAVGWALHDAVTPDPDQLARSLRQRFVTWAASPDNIRAPGNTRLRAWAQLAVISLHIPAPRSSSSRRAASASATTSLQAAHRARRQLALGRQVAEHDRAARAAWGQLDDMHLLGPRVVVDGEADLVAVELDRAVDVADQQDHNLKGPV